MNCSSGISEIGVGADYISIKIRKIAYYENKFVGYLTRKTPEICVYIKPNEQRLQPQNIHGQNEHYGF